MGDGKSRFELYREVNMIRSIPRPSGEFSPKEDAEDETGTQSKEEEQDVAYLVAHTLLNARISRGTDQKLLLTLNRIEYPLAIGGPQRRNDASYPSTCLKC